MRLHLVMLALVSGLVLSGCQPQQRIAVIVPAGPELDRPLGATVPTRRAVALFESICAGTLPRFAGSEARARANGITQQSNGAEYLIGEEEEISFELTRAPAGQLCRVTFLTADDTNQAVVALGEIVDEGFVTNYGFAAPFRNTEAFVVIRPPIQVGDLTGYGLELIVAD